VSNQLSQLPIEALVLSSAPVPAQLSQLPIEALRSSTPEPITAGQLSQLPIEILLLPVAGELDVTQLAAELARLDPSSAASTQLVAEIAHQQIPSAVNVTQALIEVVRDRSGAPGLAIVTQLLIEVLRVPTTPVPPGLHPPRTSACPGPFPPG